MVAQPAETYRMGAAAVEQSPQLGRAPQFQIQMQPRAHDHPMAATAAAPAVRLAPYQVPVAHLHNTSHRHPVFFTDKLRKAPPFAVSMAPVSSPVAHGYVHPESQRTAEKGTGSRL
jgi:hypothetical protein